MKKLIVLAVLSGALFANSTHYKLGFENSLEATAISLKNNGHLPQYFNLKNDFVVYQEISNVDSATILLMEYLAFKEGFVEVKTTRKYIFYGSFERSADANVAQAKLKRLLNGANVKISKKSSFNPKELITYSPYVNEISNKVVNEIQRSGNVVVRREVTEVPVIKEKQKVVYKQAKPKVIYKEPETQKIISIINSKAQAYKIEDGALQESEIVQKGEFDFGSVRKIGNDEFVKVKDKNIYFLQRDTQVKVKWWKR